MLGDISSENPKKITIQIYVVTYRNTTKEIKKSNKPIMSKKLGEFYVRQLFAEAIHTYTPIEMLVENQIHRQKYDPSIDS